MDEFKNRRNKLAQQLSNDSIMLLRGAKLQHRNSDVEYFFRQNSDFYYLTGFAEPDAVMALIKDAKGQVEYVLFNRPNDPEAEIWNGKRAGQAGAKLDFGADAAYDIADLDKIIPTLLENKKIFIIQSGLVKNSMLQL
jgi:Xaa-Pro aminopeptidase